MNIQLSIIQHCFDNIHRLFGRRVLGVVVVGGDILSYYQIYQHTTQKRLPFGQKREILSRVFISVSYSFLQNLQNKQSPRAKHVETTP